MKVEALLGPLGSSDQDCLWSGSALVTGGAKGIGRAIVDALVRVGIPTAVLDSDATSLRETVDELAAQDARVTGSHADIADQAAVEQAFAAAQAEFGPIGMVVANAGIAAFGDAVTIPLTTFDRAVDVNLRGPFLTARAAIPHLRAHGGGSIVVVASNAGLVARPEDPVYCATKAGAVMLARSLALSLAADRIRVNAVCPGPVDTPLYRSVVGPDSAAGTQERVLASVPLGRALGRVAMADEVADLCLYLLSERAAYVTGAAIPIDGGKTAGVQVVREL